MDLVSGLAASATRQKGRRRQLGPARVADRMHEGGQARLPAAPSPSRLKTGEHQPIKEDCQE
jgi:hypothetical protein